MSSHTHSAATTIRESIVVPVPVERAFRVFTEDFGAFKPAEHNLLAVEIAETVFEPFAGGHLYDRGIDGSECRWARVLAYEPPDRVVLSWDIGPTWQLETDPDRTSEVEVRFIPEGPDRTRVLLEHRYLDRHGEGWEAVRDGAGSDQGWPLYLRRFEALARGGAGAPRSGAVDPGARLAEAEGPWEPRIVAMLNDYKVLAVKAAGDFVWHRHEETDDFFLVLKGRLTIQLRDRDVELREGELFVVPRGVEHCPRADEEAWVLVIEPQETINTGDAGGPLTAEAR